MAKKKSDELARLRESIEAEPATVADVTALVPWDKNPRKNSDAEVVRVADWMRRFGWTAPIIARRDSGEIIAGHTRYRAALSLGLTQVPVRFIECTDEEAAQIAVIDNRSVELGQWDVPKLLDVLEPMGLEGAEFAGFDGEALKDFGSALIDGPAPPDDFDEFDQNLETEHTCPKCGYEW